MRPLLLLLALGGCSMATVDAPDTEASSLPLLPDGLSVGGSFYGGGTFEGLTDGLQATLDDGIDSGLSAWTYYLEWSDLEAEAGRYTLDTFEQSLADAQARGLRPFVNVTIGDSEGFSLPAGVSDPNDLDDPEVIERFGKLLDEIVPTLVARGGMILGLGTEMGEYLDGDRETRETYARFVDAARQRVHTIEPRLAVGVTLTTGAIRERSPTYRSMREVSDVVAFNYGPIPASFVVLDLEDIRRDFREVLDASGDGPIVIQELT